jgi:2-amino-4-hydroxy-6-hydroxymethyldihydropteridine diphosphokinase
VHEAYLSLGSNIRPEANLLAALDLLQGYGEIRKISGVWESQAVGSEGPNFLNACVKFMTARPYEKLKQQVLRPLEAKLGRQRSADRYAPRPIDIDIVIFDGSLCKDKFWDQAFVVVPLAEIHPHYRNPKSGESASETAARLRQRVWMEMRPEVLSRTSGGSFQPPPRLAP